MGALIAFILLAIAIVAIGLATASALVCRVLLAIGIVRKRWHVIVINTCLMALVPAYFIRLEQIRLGDCLATFGPDDHFCSGEVGGFIRDGVEWGAMCASLVFGPLIGRFLALKWIGPKDSGGQ